jgi:transcriptional regulator with XRE-family HTH domain
MEKDTIATINIGEKIRALRLQRGETLKDVAQETGLSTALISQIENSIVSPPISTLLRIAEALNVKIGFFFQEDEQEKKEYVVVRADERKPVFREGSKYGYSYKSLAHGKTDRQMEPFFVHFTKEKMADEEVFCHDGEEFLYILKGTVEYLVGGERIILKEGDSLYLSSNVPHKGQIMGPEDAFALAVFHPSHR